MSKKYWQLYWCQNLDCRCQRRRHGLIVRLALELSSELFSTNRDRKLAPTSASPGGCIVILQCNLVKYNHIQNSGRPGEENHVFLQIFHILSLLLFSIASLFHRFYLCPLSIITRHLSASSLELALPGTCWPLMYQLTWGVYLDYSNVPDHLKISCWSIYVCQIITHI